MRIPVLVVPLLVLGAVTSVGGQITTTAGMLVPPPARPAFTVSVMLVTEVGPGESFRFVVNTDGATVTAKGVPVAFPTPLGTGAPYAVMQTDGPRACTASANRSGVVASRNITVTMDCGRPPGKSQLAGQLHAPVGTRIVLQLNGASDLALLMPAFAGSSDPYNLLPFAFLPTLPDGTPYTVTVKTAPPGQVCRVYKGGTGTMPSPLGALRVGCEVRADLVTRSTSNAIRGTYYESRDPVIGGSSTAVGQTADGYGDGRFLAFVSSAKLGSSSGAHRQVFWRDRLTGETLLISGTAAGVEGNGDSGAPSISADGLSVAFESYASNLVPNDANGVRDIFLWQANNRQLGVQRISVGVGGVEANAESTEPSISGDGRVVAFSSGASNMTPGVVGNNTLNVYRRELVSGAATLLTRGRKGLGVGGSRPSISEDGMRIAFHSASGELTTDDANNLWDIFVYDHAAGGLTRVSRTMSGGERDQGSESASRVVAPTISGDGKFVVFATTANMGPVPSGGWQNVYRAEIETGKVLLLSYGVAGAASNGDSPINQGERIALSRDGNVVAFPTSASNVGAPKGGIVLRMVSTGATLQLDGISPTNLSVGAPTLSPRGGFIAFATNQSLDPRFAGSGLFALFTGVSNSWWWFQ